MKIFNLTVVKVTISTMKSVILLGSMTCAWLS